MRADVWKALLGRIPPEQTDNLALTTAEGTEINVQTLLLMEEDWIVLRGRIAGSNEGGRIFCLPYEHLDHAGFQRPLSDSQLQTIFGIAAPSAAVPPAAEATTPEPAPEPAAPPNSQPASTLTTSVVPPAEVGMAVPGLLARVPSRSEIIQRLRKRTEARDSAAKSTKE
jgi:hypothetical protein